MSIHFRPKSFFLFAAKDRSEQSCKAVESAIRAFQREMEPNETQLGTLNSLGGETSGVYFWYGFTDQHCESSVTPVGEGAVKQLIDLPEDTDNYHPVALRFQTERINKTVGDTGSHYVRATDPETGMSCVADSGYWEKSANLARIALWARVTALEKVRIVTDKPPVQPTSEDDIRKLNAIREIVKGWENCPDELKRAIADGR